MIRRAWNWLIHGGCPPPANPIAKSLDGGCYIWDGFVGPNTRALLQQLDKMFAEVVQRRYAKEIHLRSYNRLDFTGRGVSYTRQWEAVAYSGQELTVYNPGWEYFGVGRTPEEAYMNRVRKLMKRDGYMQENIDTVERHLMRRQIAAVTYMSGGVGKFPVH